jgi:hypothetical protein
MTMSADNLVYLTDEERKRILRLNARRERDIRNGRFAPWQPAAALMRAWRRKCCIRPAYFRTREIGVLKSAAG